MIHALVVAASLVCSSSGVDSGGPAAVGVGAVRAVKAPVLPVAMTDSVAAPKDTTDLKKLPPRVLPLKDQMVFAGGFMVFIALMMTSLQNFNPND